jgi:hypothetical protein
MTNYTVKFQPANAKLKRLRELLAKEYGRNPNIYGFSLPAGYSCPFALDCLSKADRITGKLSDGPDMKFRCFQASLEALYPSMRDANWRNFEALRSCESVEEMADMLQNAIPKNADIIRFGIDGDMFNQRMFDAVLSIARMNPNIRFNAYTKSLIYWVNRLGEIPANLNLNASRGGRLDHLIEEYSLKSATVVFHPSEAEALGLEIDHDESHALNGSDSFALLIHGQQAKGSEASKAIKTLKAENIEFAYKA